MADEAQGCAVVDPLVHYWGLSLFPQTSGVLPDASKTYNTDVDLSTMHNHLRSMALRSPGKLLKQAKSIIDDNTELFNSDVLGDSASYEINDVVSEEAKENPRERRPGLGHKRARFSMKPNKIHPTEILKPNLDIDDLKDPEEFFMAHERLENAKREIQKQMGNVLLEPNQNSTSTNTRQRRPGLLGNNQRRSVKYKHRFSIVTSDNKDNVLSSQETFESGGLDPVSENPEKAEASLASPRIELEAESSAMKENNLNILLDELLHSSEDLQEDQAITLLQETLQIKPIVLEKLSIPDLPDNRVAELKTFGGNLSKPRKPLMNLDNLLKEMNKVTPVKTRQEGSPLQQLASPTPPKSPFALLPSLQKRILQSKPSVDPFSALDCDDLSTRNTSQTEMTKQGLNLVDSEEPSDKLYEPLVEDIRGSVENVRSLVTNSGNFKEGKSGEPAFGTNINSNESQVDIEVDTGDRNLGNRVIDNIVSRPGSEAANEPSNFQTFITCASTSGNSKEDNSTEPTNVVSNKSHEDMEVDVGGKDVGDRIFDDMINRENYEANEPCKFKDDIVMTCADTSGNSKEKNLKEPAFGTIVDSNISHIDMELDVGGSKVGNRTVDDMIRRANEPSEFVEKVQEVVASEQIDYLDLNLVKSLDESSRARFEDNFVDANTRASDDGPEQCSQVQENTKDSQVPVNEQSKVKSGKRKAKNDSQLPVNEQRKVKSRKSEANGLSRRQSLAVGGTSWESGVRRSTRIRSRPLEYWKGERPVYGRIHESLATVIGVKYMSPGTADGKPTMKVKSYVAEKYKELLDLASQY